MEAVAITESGFVAVGGPVCVPQNGPPTKCHGSVWTAAAGEGWTRAPDQPGLEVGLDSPSSGPGIGIFDVSAGPAGFVAIGYPYDGTGPGIWRSPDGRTWERVDGGATFTNATINAVTSGSDRYVIVGTVADPASATAPARAAA